MQQNRMYYDLAYLWPVVSPPEEYAVEAWHLREVIRARLGPGEHTLLELGVGGGHVLSHLTQDFRATAVDLSENMLALSRQLNPSVPHHLGEMRTIRLGQIFDVVLIHDAINYMLTEADLQAVFRTARTHLKPGGVFITAPDWFQETFHGPSVQHWTQSRDELEVTLIEYLNDPDPQDTTIESFYFYAIKEQGKLRVEQDHHISGIFPRSTWLQLMADAGFRAEEVHYPPYEGGYGGNLVVGVLKR